MVLDRDSDMSILSSDEKLKRELTEEKDDDVQGELCATKSLKKLNEDGRICFHYISEKVHAGCC